MRNLAGEPTEIANRVVTEELEAAGIAPVSIPEARGEVRATIIGRLTLNGGVIADFRRRWCYWWVNVSRPLPVRPANDLNKRLGDEVSVRCYSGGRKNWYINSQKGLDALVEALVSHFNTVDARKAITPDMIDLSQGLCNTFGQAEREVLAEQLVEFAQHRGEWGDFRRSEIRDFLGDDYFFLDEAEQNDFVKNNDDGTYSFTEYFVQQCYDRHPCQTPQDVGTTAKEME